MRYAAIDVGSNAIRLLIADITQSDIGYSYKKNTLVRVPLRLGDDAFLNQNISQKKIEDLIKTMAAFKNLMDVYQVSKYLACATSAMREAKNGKEIIKKIAKNTTIKLEIIAGDREANMIYANHIEENLTPNLNYLYIDVGGGSTELSVFVNQELYASNSFNIGTIRILDNQDKEEIWDEMRDWIKQATKGLKQLTGIGTGGNINKLFRMSGEKEGMPLSISKLNTLYIQLNAYTLKERITIMKLNPDRADVIVPACQIFLSLMKWGGVEQIFVPKVGMADGIINLLIEENLKA